MKRIDVIVSPKGESRIETFGFTGESCRSVTRQLEKALGIAKNENLKAEFYEQQTTKNQQKENE